MNRSINLVSLIQAKDALSSSALKALLSYHIIEVKDKEFEDLKVLCSTLISAGAKISQLENFFVGFKIQQIGKEFDLIKFDANSMINIEIKNKSTDEKILAQLKRNRYYLTPTSKSLHIYAFLASSGAIYKLDSSGNLLLSSVTEMMASILSIDTSHSQRIDSLFDPCDYLVSPFNSTDRFIEGKYFLTGHQEQIVKAISAKIGNGFSFSSISGGPGTGKSLLVYDLARTATANGHKVLIVHCGNLNSGQIDLISAGFDIIPVKKTAEHKNEKYDLIIVDEAQRIRTEQFKILIEKTKQDGITCVFSHDERQTLAAFEKRNGVSEKLKSANNVDKFELSEKIRSNAEMSDFIKLLINRKREKTKVSSENITVSYFSNPLHAVEYWKSIPSDKWKKLRLTPSQHDLEYHEKFYDGEGETSHNVIGQEFDCVAILIDDMFAYGDNGELIYKKGSYYDPVRMPFQNITRTRKKLKIVIANNEEIMKHCSEILSV